MSKHTAPQKKKVDIKSSAIITQHMENLSLGIDNSSSTSNPQMSVTTQKTNPQKEELTVIRKLPKTDHGEKYYDNRESDSRPKEFD